MRQASLRNRAAALFALLLSLAGATACNNGAVSPAAPSTTGYAGSWSGRTLQNGTISFSVSQDQVVTSMTFSYAFNGCSGTKTFANLSVPILHDNAAGASTPGSTGDLFSYQTGDEESGPLTGVQGGFYANGTAIGVIVVSGYPNCGGDTAIVWSASR